VCRRRHLEWKQAGALQAVLRALAEDLQYRAGISAGDALDRPPLLERGTWWWQTYLLLRSPDVAALLQENDRLAYHARR
jgi:hypothetical protein